MTRPPPGGRNPRPDTAPAAAERDGDLLTSSPSRGVSARARAAGAIALSGPPVDEATARKVLDDAFTAARLKVQHDYTLRVGDNLLTLDGFDPIAKIGYQYVSHGDVDVVTDFDAAAERAIRELDAAGKVRVLIVHDGDVADVEELAGLVGEFLLGLDRTFPG